jgi:hypothetical protein
MIAAALSHTAHQQQGAKRGARGWQTSPSTNLSPGKLDHPMQSSTAKSPVVVVLLFLLSSRPVAAPPNYDRNHPDANPGPRNNADLLHRSAAAPPSEGLLPQACPKAAADATQLTGKCIEQIVAQPPGYSDCGESIAAPVHVRALQGTVTFCTFSKGVDPDVSAFLLDGKVPIAEEVELLSTNTSLHTAAALLRVSSKSCACGCRHRWTSC